jgi:MoaA/NifB/PqqE/SkfB family radical SAM enzyme
MIKHYEKQSREKLKESKPLVYAKCMEYANKVKEGESIAILQIQYDYTCNMKCNHCCITTLRNKSRRALTAEDIKDIAIQADNLGLAHVVITGGEPLLFPDLTEVVKAIDPSKFYISLDTNGWNLNKSMARLMKSIGIDKIQLSLDSMSEKEHDAFRNKPGSYDKAIRAIDAALAADLQLLLATVVTKQRVRSDEFINMLTYAKSKGIDVFVTYAKPVGEWAGKDDMLIDKEDIAYVASLAKDYPVFTHLTPAYGLDLGCIAVKRMVSITKYGDVMPCPYIHMSMGNIFHESLQTILGRGMIAFKDKVNTCLIAEDRNFIKAYSEATHKKQLPITYTEIK